MFLASKIFLTINTNNKWGVDNFSYSTQGLGKSGTADFDAHSWNPNKTKTRKKWDDWNKGHWPKQSYLNANEPENES